MQRDQLMDLARIAHHEVRLSLRDLAAMMRGGRRARLSAAMVAIILAALLHLVAWVTVRRYGAAANAPDIRTLIVISTAIALSSCLFISQAMESTTRVIYGRGDLELILSSPVSARAVLAVRIASVGLSIGCMTLFTAGPFANVLAYGGGVRWLGIYPVALAVGLAMTALGLLATLGLVQLVGPQRTRLASQIAAAVIGATFAIGLQIAAIVQYGEVSRFALVASDALVALAPDAASLLWLPARAATGDLAAALTMTLGGLGAFAGILFVCRDRLVTAAYSTAATVPWPARSPRSRRLNAKTPAASLMRKEWHLLARDPWLASQTLMQILYLLPPAVMLWHSFGGDAGRLALLAPMLVMVAGQLAGGLAWLAISGEDSPDLIATAPVHPGGVSGAKLAAVMAIVGVIVGPFALGLAYFAPSLGVIVVLAGSVAGWSSFSIQTWFQQRGRRSHFRRRQTASRIATFAEAFSSIAWAATAGLATISIPMATISGFIVLVGLRIVKALSQNAAA